MKKVQLKVKKTKIVKSRRLNLTGQKFGKLLALRFYEMREGQSFWLFKCDCGKDKIALAKEVKRGKLQSCGCFRGKNYKIHGDYGTKFHNIWNSMRRRCKFSSHNAYKNYGGRGIIYDSKWEKFIGFKEDMYFKYLYAKKQLKVKNPSIERKNVNGNYCKENCIFIELIDQAKNRRCVKWFHAISPSGEIFIARNATEFARNHNLNRNHINDCLRGDVLHHKKWKFVVISK